MNTLAFIYTYSPVPYSSYHHSYHILSADVGDVGTSTVSLHPGLSAIVIIIVGIVFGGFLYHVFSR